jgi:hypothetical protein
MHNLTNGSNNSQKISSRPTAIRDMQAIVNLSTGVEGLMGGQPPALGLTVFMTACGTF